MNDINILIEELKQINLQLENRRKEDLIIKKRIAHCEAIILSKFNLKQLKNKKELDPPKIEDISKFVKENNLDININDFYNYYSKANWKDSFGRSIVTDWQHKALIWVDFAKNKTESICNSFNKCDRKNINTDQYFIDLNDINI